MVPPERQGVGVGGQPAEEVEKRGDGAEADK